MIHKKLNSFLIGIRLFIFLGLLITTIRSNAQVSGTGIFFQAVARDNYSNPAKDRTVYVESSILQSTATGTKVLTEIHKTTTDGTGVFSISVGNGTRIGGTVSGLNNIEWAKGPYYLGLKIAIQPLSPVQNWDYTKELVDLGASPFGTVPYALYSGSSGSLDNKLSISDTAKMLAIYANAQIVNNLATVVGAKLSSTDTASMLAPYRQVVNALVASNITSLTAASVNAALESKVNLTDSLTMYVTPTQLNAKTFDSTAIYNQLASHQASIVSKLNIADSLTKYVTLTQLNAKTFDSTSIYNQLAKKALATDVTTSLGLKANTASVTTSLATKEDIANKSINVLTDATSDTKYPSVKAIKTYVDAQSLAAATGTLTYNAPLRQNGTNIEISQANASTSGYISAADYNVFNNKIDASQKAANNGVATLGNDGKIPSNQIPAISFQSANVVGSDAAMIAIPGAVVGSIAIRTDVNENYVLSSLPSSILSNWLRLRTPTSVTSINGNAGPTVVLTTNEIAEGVNNKYYTDSRVRNAISATTPLSFNSTTGTISMTAVSGSTNGYLNASDYTAFNNKQNAITAGIDYLAPNGSAANLTSFPTFNQSTTGNAATATKLASTKNINGVAFDGSSNITIAADANTLTGTTLASTVTNSSLTSVGTITSGTWSGTAINFSKLNISKANIISLGIQETLTASQAGVLSNTSGTNTGDETVTTIKNKLGITSLSGANTGDQTITLTGDVSGSGNGSFTTTVNSIGGVNSSTISGFDTRIISNTSSITSLTNSVNANTNSITINSNDIASLNSSLNTKADLASPTFTGTVSGITKSMVGLSNVENTALSTWTGSNNLSGVGTITSGTWSGTVIGSNVGGAGSVNGILKANGSGVVTAATAGTDFQTPITAAPTTGQFLTSAAGGTYTWTAASSVTGVPYTGATGSVNLGAYDLTVSGLTVGRGNGAIATNTAVGAGALSSTTGLANTAVGAGALGKATSPNSNTAVGAYALRDVTTGGSNTAIGSYASSKLIDGQRNIAIGYSALDNLTANSDNTAVGYESIRYNNGTNNTALGANSLMGPSSPIASGGDNTAIGKDALKSANTAAKNTALGSGSLLNLTTGNENTAIGYNAGSLYGSGVGANLTNLRQGILIGGGARALFNNSLNEIAIGYGTIGNGSNTVTVGNLSNTATYFTGDINLTGNINGGTWSGTVIGSNKGGAGSVNGLMKANGSGVVSAAVAGTDFMAANATTTLTGDVTGIGSGSFATTVNSVGGVSSATIAGFDSRITSNTSSITSFTSSINANTNSITINSNDIASLNSSLNTKADLASPTFTGTVSGITKSMVGLGNVENTALSTWTGSTNLSSVGTITSGTWSATAIDFNKLNISKANITSLGIQETLTAGTGISIGSGTISVTGLTTANIASSTDKNYVTDAQAGVISNTAGVNTGDQTNIAGNAATATNIAGGAAGSIPYQTAAATTAMLAKGTDGQVLTLASGVPSWSTINSVSTLVYDGTTTFSGGGSIGGSTLTLGTAKVNAPGFVSALAQTFGGVKTFTPDVTASSGVAVGTAFTPNLTANANNNVLVGVDINPTFTNGVFTPVANYGLRVQGIHIGKGGGNIANNTAVGLDALKNNGSSGGSNTAFGWSSLTTNTSGGKNTAVGKSALTSNSIGSDNTAIGSDVLIQSTAGNNTALGSSALNANSSGSNNTAIGSYAGSNITTGPSNIFVGFQAGTYYSTGSTTNTNTTGLNSVLIGYDVRPLANADNNEIVISGYNGSAGTVGLGSHSTLIGNSLTKKSQIYGVLTTVPSAASSTLEGESSIIQAQSSTGPAMKGGSVSLISGSATSSANGGNVNLTAGAGASNSTGGNIILTPGSGGAKGVAKVVGSDFFIHDDNFRVGKGVNSISSNTSLGSQTLNGNNSGTGGNTAIGSTVLYTNTTGYSNTGVGSSALFYNTIGRDNTAIGSNALNKNTEGIANTSVGKGSLSANTTGNNNIAIGNSALSDYSTTFDNNVAIGYMALRYSSANNNVAIGYTAGGSMGYNGLGAVTGGANNIFLGHKAGNNAGPVSPTVLNSTGYNSVMIGYDVRPKTNGDDNEIVISGYDGAAGTVGQGANTTSLGNANTTKAIIYGSSSISNLPSISTTGSGGDFILIAQDAIATGNTNGGNIVLTPGTANGTGTAGKVVVNSQVKITGGIPGLGKVLTSDANGLATWATASSGVSTLTYTTASSNANGATISGTTLTLSAADATNPGLVSTGTQTFAGAKTFTNTVTFKNITFSDFYNIPINGGFSGNTGQYNIGLGWNVLNSTNTGNNNIGLGYYALNANTSGVNNNAIGYNALALNTSGNNNVALGYTAMNNNTDGDYNTSIGYTSLSANTTGNRNTVVGANALSLITTNGDNTAVGYYALHNNTAGFNDAFGSNSLGLNTSGTGNVAFGMNTISSNTTGNYNTAIGGGALGNATTSPDNVAVGNSAGSSLTTDATNTGGSVFIGKDAGRQYGYSGAGGQHTTGYNNILIGKDARSLGNGDYNEIVISPYNINNYYGGTSVSGLGGIGGGSNTTTIGNTSTTNAVIYGSASLSNFPATATLVGGATGANGSDFVLKAQSATGAYGNGGNIVLTPGAAISGSNNGVVKVNGSVQITGGTPGLGKVLTSDASGVGTWIAPVGVSSLGAFSSTSNAKGGVINGTTLTLTAADETNPGLISTGAQTIVGTKTFSSTTTNYNGKVKIVDGTQAVNKVLTSDANGLASWANPLPAAQYGTLATSDNHQSISLTGNGSTTNTYLNSYITLPVGKWDVYLNILTSATGTTTTGTWWVRMGLSTSSSSLINTKSTLENPTDFPINTLLSGRVTTTGFDMIQGHIIINNTSGSAKNYYLWTGGCDLSGANGSSTLEKISSSTFGENLIFALPMY